MVAWTMMVVVEVVRRSKILGGTTMGLLGELDVACEEKRRIHDFKLFLLRNSWGELPFATMRKPMGGVICRGGDHESVVQC